MGFFRILAFATLVPYTCMSQPTFSLMSNTSSQKKIIIDTTIDKTTVVLKTPDGEDLKKTG